MCVLKSLTSVTIRQKFNKPVTILLKAFHKLAKDWLGQPFTSLLQACDKPTESCFLQQNFRLYWIQEDKFFIFINYLNFIVSLIFFIFNANCLCFIFGVFNRLSISFSSVFYGWKLCFPPQNFHFIQFIEYKFWVVTL